MQILFLLIGAILVLFMHCGFAFLEAGSVRTKNQVHSLVKILVDFGVCGVVYIFFGYFIAYKQHFFIPAVDILADNQGLMAVRSFFLMTFAGAVPAIISGGIAERAMFRGQICASVVIVGLIYPFMEGILWNNNYGVQDMIQAIFGQPIHDFAGSGLIHLLGGVMALAAVIILGPRMGRVKNGKLVAIPPSNIPFLALGTWILVFGWFGFNVMSAQHIENISGLVALNSLLALMGGIIGGLVFGQNDPGYIHNGALAGLVAVCAGSDIMHPIGALITGIISAGIFISIFPIMHNRFKIDDVLGVFPLHGLGGLWGMLAAGIFGQTFLGGLGGVSIWAQIIGILLIGLTAFVAGYALYWVVKRTIGLRMDPNDEFIGADLAFHKITAYPEDHFK